MKRNITNTIYVLLSLFMFSGCSTYYYTASQGHELPTVKEEIPVKIALTQKDWSIVVKLPDKDIKKNISDVVFDNPVFREDNSSDRILKVDIVHSNDHGGAELSNALLTGASLYLIPGVADSDVSIDISIGDFTTNYKGELIVAQGMGASSMIDKEKYKEDQPLNLMKNLIKNAIDKFTTAYMKK